MNQGVASVLESLKASDLDAARSKIQEMMEKARNDREKGSVMAAAGILASMSKGKDGTVQTWEAQKVARAAQAIRRSQMADDWDRGYAETLSSYARLLSSKE